MHHLPHSLRRPTGRKSRRGFTLVELLISISIFVILATLALSAFRETDQDRAAAGAQQLRSMFEGARSRAIHDGQLRGIRLVLESASPNDPRSKTVTSLVYIGAPRLYEGTLAVGDISSDTANPPNWTLTDSTSSHVWLNLVKRGLLIEQDDDTATAGIVEWSPIAGVRIEVPADSGRWFRLKRRGSYISGNTVTLGIAGHYEPSAYNGSNYDVTPPASGEISYRLELAPPILPGAAPKPLANGIAIDLVACKLPNAWRDDSMTTGDLTDDLFSTSMDILFSPRGDVVGNAAAAGVLNFVIADVGDIANGNRYPSADKRYPLLQSEKPDRLVTLFTRTGLVITSQLNHFDGTDNPYALALQGQDAP